MALRRRTARAHTVTRIPRKGTFSDTLYRLRKAAGYSRAEMARLIGTAPPNITRVESGAVGVSERIARSYAKALGLNVRLVFEPKR